jgi:zinc protease
MEFVRTEVDGVPTFWAEAGTGLQAGLVFRVGRADETLARGGISHLVEHLALHQVGQTDYHFNGTTGPITTTYFTQGDPDEIAQFLAAVCRALRDLPMDRLLTERGILRTEWSGRTRGLTEPLLVWRYGPATFGLPTYREYGLEDLTPDDLRSWAARWCTRGNAALWVTGGPPPRQLRLDLPDGPRMAVPEPSSALPRTPAFFSADVDGVAFDAVVRRTSAAGLFGALLDRWMHATLRRERGTSYAAWATYQPRDGEHGVVTAAADAPADKQGEVTAAFVDLLAGIAAGSVAEDDLRAVRARARDALSRPEAAAALVPNAAVNLLTGGPVLTARQIRDELEALTIEHVQAVAEEALASGLLMVPAGQSVGRAGFVPAPAWSSTAVTGRSVKSLDYPVDRRRLLVGSDGLSLVDGRRVATVRFADCVGMLAWPDGARSLFGADAMNVHVEPRLWRLPAGALQHVDMAIPPDRVAHLPDRPAETQPKPSTRRGQRMQARLRPYLTQRVVAPVVVAVAVLVLILAFPSSKGTVDWGRALTTGITVAVLGVVMRLLVRRM